MSGAAANGNPAWPPRATYRVQLGTEGGLDAAAGIVPYLRALGISHFYASPFLEARRGSQHGYDITAHDAINPELGGREAFDRLSDALAENGLGLILDFVPNHMGVGRNDNAWWLDLLEWGQASPYADYFDIDWQPAKRELRGKVLLPFLGAHYGEVLEAGELSLTFDAETGAFSVWYYEHRFPIAPRQYPRILLEAAAATRTGETVRRLRDLAQAFRTIPTGRHRRGAAREQAIALTRELASLHAASTDAQAAIDEALRAFNGTPGRPASFRLLHALLERQAYRLAYWRVASDEINYRRFFDINDLAGLRVERDDLFAGMHRFVFDLVAEGRLHGLRIDHIDGLFDPRGYCERLMSEAGAAARRSGHPQPYLVVEKILAPHESLPESWSVHGTTGYEFATQVGGLFVDPDGERPMTRIYRQVTGDTAEFDAHVLECRRLVMDRLLASELQVLANQIDLIAESGWRTRDFTLNTLKDVLKEIVAAFPVYRTYVDSTGAGPGDRRDIDWAVGVARKRSAAPRDAFDFVHAALTTDLASQPHLGRSAAIRRRITAFAMKVQQFTSPVAAKGVEDTALYRYHRFVALNEVGGEPDRFGTAPAALHRFNQDRARRWPQTMLSTSTHDTKRGEDVRARLYVLSERPQLWLQQVRGWMRLNRRALTRTPEGRTPDAGHEYLIYQTLVGSWPLELDDADRLSHDTLADYRDRIQAYLVKAAREAKLHTSWTDPDAEYEGATQRFVDRTLDPDRGAAFLQSFIPFQNEIALAGAVNGLAQTVAKLTSPGVPDVYQGTERWELSLVDPDNRRPVDCPALTQSLQEMRETFGERGERTKPAMAATLLRQWRDGRIKQYVTWRMLALRAEMPALFAEGAYQPLRVEGRLSDRLFAYARIRDREVTLFALPRLMSQSVIEAGRPLPPPEVWEDTAILLPPGFETARFRDLFTGAELKPESDAGEPGLRATALFGVFPVAALVGRFG